MPSIHPDLGREAAALDPWVDLLDLALGESDQASLVRLDRPADAPEQVDVALLPLDGVHPAKLLVGYEPPPACVAIGVVVGGWAAPLDGTRPSQHPARQRVTTTVLVDRAGNVAGRVRVADGAELPIPCDGELLQLLRAAMTA